jgi:glutamine amidotransferase
MVGVIDYGVGNISAFRNIYKHLNIPAISVSKESDLSDIKKIILPGVGHFDYAMSKFQDSSMLDRVNKMVLEQNIPVLGICVGMQMMAKCSDEGVLPGLGWIDAKVKKFDSGFTVGESRLPLPHMGWNDVVTEKATPILKGLENDSQFYFLHSYYFMCNDENDIVAKTNYGADFTCAVNHKKVYGVQFHPEKSHKYGIQLLKNFAELC